MFGLVGHPGDRKVEVRYVDFGDKKILSVSDLRKIKNEFFALPSMVITQLLFDQLLFCIAVGTTTKKPTATAHWLSSNNHF